MDKRISRQYFNNLANTWDDAARNNVPEKLKVLANRLDLPCEGWILDVGTGTGVFLPYIKDSVNEKSQIISMDFALNMVMIAKSKQTDKGIQFICAEIETLRLGSQLFDSVICYSTFPHFHNKPLALENIYANLKKGGCLYICHTASREFINQIHSNIPDLKDHLIPEDSEMKELLISSGFIYHQIDSSKDYYMVTATK
jgi:ubiquinone/menaquinone biosynthesis C-methylase UbiE